MTPMDVASPVAAAEVLRAAADERIRAQVEAATNKRTTAKRKRAQRAAARNAGLDTRHRTKLTRLQQETNNPHPEGVHG